MVSEGDRALREDKSSWAKTALTEVSIWTVGIHVSICWGSRGSLQGKRHGSWALRIFDWRGVDNPCKEHMQNSRLSKSPHLLLWHISSQLWLPGWEASLEGGMATHSSILAWRGPWTEKPGSLWSIGSQRIGHDWSNLACMLLIIIVQMGLIPAHVNCLSSECLALYYTHHLVWSSLLLTRDSLLLAPFNRWEDWGRVFAKVRELISPKQSDLASLISFSLSLYYLGAKRGSCQVALF